MSYSRWLESTWYVYPCTVAGRKCVECLRAGDWHNHQPRWTMDETLDEFLARAKSLLSQDEALEEDMEELKSILESNLEDILNWIGRK